MVKTEKGEIPCIFYFYLQSKLREHSERDKMSLNEFKWRMFQWKIPKQIKPLIVKEMELLGIIEKEGKREIKFLDTKFSVDNLGDFYEQLGIF